MGLEFDQSEYLVKVLLWVRSNRMQNKITQPCDEVLKIELVVFVLKFIC